MLFAVGWAVVRSDRTALAAATVSGAAMEVIDELSEAADAAAKAIEDALSGDGDPLLEETFSLNLWNFDADEGAAADDGIVLYENGPLSITCTNCWVSLSSWSVVSLKLFKCQIRVKYDNCRVAHIFCCCVSVFLCMCGSVM